jgi:hypothetical protein
MAQNIRLEDDYVLGMDALCHYLGLQNMVKIRAAGSSILLDRCSKFRITVNYKIDGNVLTELGMENSECSKDWQC